MLFCCSQQNTEIMGKKISVTLRMRKGKSGRKSLYLDIYANGVRKYEYLDMYLTGGRDPIDKEADRMTRELAEQICRRRRDELEFFGLSSYVKARRAEGADFIVWLRQYAEGKSNRHTRDTYCSVAAVLSEYHPVCTFGDLCPEFFEDFKKWIVKTGRQLSTCSEYFCKLLTAAREAMHQGFLQTDPTAGVQGIRAHQPRRCYLTIDELQRMSETPERNGEVRRAFLFSCLTGLRLSDIIALTWGQVQQMNGIARLVFRQQKTRGQMYLDISPNALPYMGRRGADGDKVFAGLTPTPSAIVRQWAARAGISKRVTFHTGRHTFAVMMLSLGVDIYTVSKMLGHTDLKTTQIYAEIVDAKRQEAVMRLPRLAAPAMS